MKQRLPIEFANVELDKKLSYKSLGKTNELKELKTSEINVTEEKILIRTSVNHS